VIDYPGIARRLISAERHDPWSSTGGPVLRAGPPWG